MNNVLRSLLVGSLSLTGFALFATPGMAQQTSGGGPPADPEAITSSADAEFDPPVPTGFTRNCNVSGVSGTNQYIVQNATASGSCYGTPTKSGSFSANYSYVYKNTSSSAASLQFTAPLVVLGSCSHTVTSGYSATSTISYNAGDLPFEIRGAANPPSQVFYYRDLNVTYTAYLQPNEEAELSGDMSGFASAGQ